MGQARAALAIGVPIIFLLAGCVSGTSQDTGGDPDAPPPAAPPADFDDSTGAIEGQVTDEELRPVSGAVIGIIELNERTALSDVEGKFTLSNVPPGSYKLHAARLGHESQGKSIEVVAGSVSTVNFVLPVLAVDDKSPLTIIDPGIVRNGVAFVRSATCTNCGNSEETRYVFPKGLPVDFTGLTIEVVWQSRDFLGIDFLDRPKGFMYWRTRTLSPVHFLIERCGDYVGEPWFGRQKVPCLDEELEGNTISIEDWYVGEFMQYTQYANPVCQTTTGPLPGYQAGCYGAGFVAELKFTNYLTIWRDTLPPDAKQLAFRPDG